MEIGTSSTRRRIINASIDLFGTRGVEAVSLDVIAREVGVRKQTVLYWFSSKEALVDAVFEAAAAELVVVIEAAIRATDDDALARIEAVIKAAFRPAVRRPALLALLRELSRLPDAHVDRLRVHLQPLIDRGTEWLELQMDKGQLRPSDPGLIAALAYSTLTGIATEPVTLGAVGWSQTPAGLRRLRDELVAFVGAALRPEPECGCPAEHGR